VLRTRFRAALAAAGFVVIVAATLAAGSGASPTPVCRPTVTVLAPGQGSPDDLALDGSRLLVSDINRGTIGVVASGHIRTLIGHIREPEGMVPLAGKVLIVAEQATNRILRVDLKRRSIKPILKLRLPPKKTGVDDIEAAPDGAIYVPDSANGRLYLLRSRRLALLARGMNRPVAAIPWKHGVAVADEYANAVWLVVGHRRTQLASLPLPDDLATVSNHLIAVSLAGGIWEVAPHLRKISAAFKDPQGLVATGRSSLAVADQTTNAVYRVSGLAPCL
jgi:hypothetical protein